MFTASAELAGQDAAALPFHFVIIPSAGWFAILNA